MKRVLSFLLAVAMVMALAAPAMAEESTYDIQVLTTDATCDEVFSHMDPEGFVEYYWYEGIRLDVIIAGTSYSGITPHEFEVLLYEHYPDAGTNISYGSIAQTKEDPWVKGEAYECTLAVSIGDGFDVYPVNVTICDTTVTGVDIQVMPYQNYFGDPVITATFADGSTLCSDSEFVNLRYTCENWPSIPGSTQTVSGYLGTIPMDATVTVGKLNTTIDTDIVVDELFGYTQYVYDPETGEETGETYMYYDWERCGVFDATVQGTKHKNITFTELLELMGCTGGISIYYPNDDSTAFEQTADDPWQVGGKYTACVMVDNNKGMANLLLGQEIHVVVSETQIASISAEPVTYYAYEGSANPEFTVTYKDGSTGLLPEGLEYGRQEDWPTTPGEHTVTFLVEDQFEVPVQVTVLPNPTSGKLGDTVSWRFDENTKTLTISGTGSAVCEMDIERRWSRLLMVLDVKHVVVEEGVEALFDLCFFMAPTVESISLPASLREMPLVFLGLNGPSQEADLGLEIESAGVTTLVIPENITDWTNTTFYYAWGIQDIYLPSGLKTVSLENLCYIPWMRQQMGLAEQALTIHFAGTEAQWEAITFVTPNDEYAADIGTGLSEAELMELYKTLTIVYDDPADCYSKEIPVKNGVATVPDDAVEVTQGKDVVIDVTDTQEKAESVVIGSETVDKITEAETAVEVKLPDAAVSFDKEAISSVSQQAGDASVTIVAKEVQEETLTSQQAAALEDQEVVTILTLEAYAGETKITQFGGGKVTVSVPFDLPQGKTGEDFFVAYVAADGTITPMPTAYADGVLRFETTHFSNYVVMEKKAATPEADPSNPQTGDTAPLMLFAVLMVASAAAMVTCVTKRKMF